MFFAHGMEKKMAREHETPYYRDRFEFMKYDDEIAIFDHITLAHYKKLLLRIKIHKYLITIK